MQVTHELINRFFENKCSDIEIEAIILYFSEHSREIDKYLSKEEWDNISTVGSLDPGLTEKIKKALWAKLFPAHSPRNIPFYRKHPIWSAAASVILITGLSWLLLQKKPAPTILTGVQQTILPKPKATINTDTTTWITRQNHSNQTEKIQLQDGSVISLYSNSAIRYPAHFEASKRDIYLTGEAFFEVAKDKMRPFTVYAGVLSTTALGTSFRVKMIDAKKQYINVQLFTGKVIIRPTEKLSNWNNDIILTPGEQLAYQGKNNPVKVSLLSSDPSLGGITEVTHNKTLAENKDMHFNNSSLTEVLKELAGIFNINIHFTDTEIAKMNFTGTINRSDDVRAILKLIAQMNGLELNESADGFTITKAK